MAAPHGLGIKNRNRVTGPEMIEMQRVISEAKAWLASIRHETSILVFLVMFHSSNFHVTRMLMHDSPPQEKGNQTTGLWAIRKILPLRTKGFGPFVVVVPYGIPDRATLHLEQPGATMQ